MVQELKPIKLNEKSSQLLREKALNRDLAAQMFQEALNGVGSAMNIDFALYGFDLVNMQWVHRPKTEEKKDEKVNASTGN